MMQIIFEHVTAENLFELPVAAMNLLRWGKYRLYSVEMPWLADVKYVLVTHKGRKFFLTATGKPILVNANELEFKLGNPVFLVRGK